MNRIGGFPTMRTLVAGLLGLILPLPFAAAQEKREIAPGSAVTITVTQASAPTPPVSITLHERHGHVKPCGTKCAHSGGGLIDVQQPSADTIVVTMSGAVIADSAMDFDLQQCFEVTYDKPSVKKAKLTVEGRVIGVLRGGKKSCAEYNNACATVAAAGTEIITLCVPPHQVCGCENLSVNDHDGPKTVPVGAGKYSLCQKFHIAAYGGILLGHKASAEFADGAIDALWLSYHEPFHGIAKKDFGFQITIKVAEDTDEAPAEKKPEEVAPPKKEVE